MGEAKRRSAAGETPRRRRKSGGPWTLVAALVVLLAVIAGLLYWLTSPSLSPIDDLPKAADGAPPFPAELDRHGVSVGPADAPVVVREFADYQCPGCAVFADSAERLRSEYVDSGKVRFVYFDMPLPQHANAVPAALAARCAGDQDAYWRMQELLFDRQGQWQGAQDPKAVFSGYAGELGLQAEPFEQCLRTERHLGAVQRSLQAAQQMRVTSTPTVYVDNVQLTRPGWYQLAGVVERHLQGATE